MEGAFGQQRVKVPSSVAPIHDAEHPGFSRKMISKLIPGDGSSKVVEPLDAYAPQALTPRLRVGREFTGTRLEFL